MMGVENGSEKEAVLSPEEMGRTKSVEPVAKTTSSLTSATALIAAVVYQANGQPLQYWPLTAGWLALLGLLAFLMVSTWRYQSFKNLELRRIQSQLLVIALIGVIYIIREPALLALAAAYVGSGIVVRIGGVVRRRFRHSTPEPERQVG